MKWLIIIAVFFVYTYADDEGIERYLSEFGYFNPSAFDSRDFSESLREFQHTFGLPVTGRVDNITTELIGTPRCGRPDNENEGNGLSYFTQKWRRNQLTYYFHSFTNDMYKKDIIDLTAKAFKFWSDVTPLSFRRLEGNSGDIVIAFGSKTHYDNRRGKCRTPFDGAGKVLAHAYYPEDGRLHFDDDEKFAKSRWTWGGKNYLWIAVHEIGHILGLSHDTKDKNAIMYPYYRSFNSNMKLGSSDIRRIQNIYGRR